jgi:predicted DCC family thiol-disulfide oxidoreductase YuxK
MPERGWMLYDGDCPWCTGLARRWEGLLAGRGFAVEPLQSPWVGPRLGLPPERLLDELRVLTVDDRRFGGADAIVFLAGHVWWALPFVAFSKLPGVLPLLRFVYRKVAERRRCRGSGCVLHAR